MSVVIRLPYAYDSDAVSRETGLLCPEDSLAVQSERDECDINFIMEKFGRSGQLPSSVSVPLNMDFEGIFDFQSAMNLIVEAERGFSSLPANVRSRFGNDPANFVNFCSDPSNLDEMRKLGLAIPAKQDVGVSGAVAPDAKPGGDSNNQSGAT